MYRYLNLKKRLPYVGLRTIVAAVAGISTLVSFLIYCQ